MAELKTYLDEVRQGLQSELPPRAVNAVLIETEAHLRERMEALIELGAPDEAAEREAVDSFGGATTFIQETIDAHQPSRKALDATTVRLAIYASAVALVAPYVAVSTLNPYLFLLPLPFLLGLMAVSFRARRAVPLKMGAVSAGLFITFWVACSLTIYSLDFYGGSGMFPKWEAAEIKQFYRANEGATVLGEELRKRRIALHASGDPVALVQRWGLTKGDQLLAPTNYNVSPPRVDYEPMAPVDALARWKNSDYLSRSLIETGSTSRASSSALSQAERAGFIESLRATFPEARPMGGIWLALLLGANLLGAGLGRLRHTLRRVRIVVRLMKD